MVLVLVGKLLFFCYFCCCYCSCSHLVHRGTYAVSQTPNKESQFVIKNLSLPSFPIFKYLFSFFSPPIPLLFLLLIILLFSSSSSILLLLFLLLLLLIFLKDQVKRTSIVLGLSTITNKTNHQSNKTMI